ncbi:zebrafish testis-expressed 38 isoform X2 [Corythoichthys intestinalis]|uniref:zebrafish testis-expressed 38 isoform X2 n=1 Tax=Corythoichthys intestinalis TaxID=161448 RepID=UPI0025A68A82|nr:zebrafish testis-expressed 38 isoform X2 [Corythoichthys intestinalis]
MATEKSAKKRKEDTPEWLGLFPNDLKNKAGSLAFVKRMLAVAVSTITYLRGIFPENAYRSKYLEDLCIKILREDDSATGASKVVKWLFGCFDALDKQYLQIIFIGVFTSENAPNCITESYSFKFKYTTQGPEMDILKNNDVAWKVTLEDTKKATVVLIRKLFLLTQNLSVLPDNVHLTMKLYYYDDITPADYEPPGFKKGTCDSLLFEGTAVDFTLGDIQTTFHTFQVRVSAESGRLGKLKGGNQVKETQQTSTSGKEIDKSPCKIVSAAADDNETLPSESESAQFKAPKKPMRKAAIKRHRRH